MLVRAAAAVPPIAVANAEPTRAGVYFAVVRRTTGLIMLGFG